MLGQYDRWKLEDGDDPGRDCAREIPLLRCQGCEFRGIFAAAVEHFRQTNHTLTFRGKVQNFDKFKATTTALVTK